MKQRGIGNRFSLEVDGRNCLLKVRAGADGKRVLGNSSRQLGRSRLEPGYQLVELQLLQPLADGTVGAQVIEDTETEEAHER